MHHDRQRRSNALRHKSVAASDNDEKDEGETEDEEDKGKKKVKKIG